MVEVKTTGLVNELTLAIEKIVSGDLFLCELVVDSSVRISSKGDQVISLIPEFLYFILIVLSANRNEIPVRILKLGPDMFLDIFQHLLTMITRYDKKIQQDDPLRSPADDVIAFNRIYFDSGE